MEDPGAGAIIVALVAVAVLLALAAVGGLLTGKAPRALDPEKYLDFPLIEREEISHDTRRFRFGLPSPKHEVGLPVGQHISLRFIDPDGKEVLRSYTPTSSNDDKGYVDFVIKVYRPLAPKFPAGGKMSQHLDSLAIGDTISMRGPKGHLEYKGRGSFVIAKPRKPLQTVRAKHVGMIAGGTGITPMLQIIAAVTKAAGDNTKMSLIFANQTEEDILVRDMLEDLARRFPGQFHLHYTLDRPSAGWGYSTGFINVDMVREHLPAPGPDTFVLVCGPPPMIKHACEPAFEALGHSRWFAF